MAQFRDRRLQDGPGACRHDLAIVQHCLNVAIREWSLPLKVNPVLGIRKPPPSRPRTRRLYPGEYEQLHQGTLTMRGKYLWPCIVLALETAMRKGELLSLQWQHVYWEKGLVYLPDSEKRRRPMDTLCTPESPKRCYKHFPRILPPYLQLPLQPYDYPGIG